MESLQVEKPKPGDVEDGYRFLGGDPSIPANWEKVEPLLAKGLVQKAAQRMLEPNPIAQGMRKAFVTGAGMVADVPQNLRDLALAGLSMARHKIHGEPLTEIDPSRKASSWLMEKTRPAWEYEPQGRADRAFYTAGEIAGAGLMGGGAGTAKGLLYNIALPTAGGVIGEQIGGETGKLVGSIAAPVGVGVAEAGARAALRTGGYPGAVKTLESIGVRPVAGDVGPMAATIQRAAEMTPVGYVVGKGVAHQRQQQISKALESSAPHGPTTGIEAGTTIKQGLRDWTSRFESNYQALRQQTRTMLPDTDTVQVTNTQRVLNELASPTAAVEAALPSGDLARFRALADAFQRGTLSAGEVRKIKTLIGDKAYPKTKLIGDYDKASYERVFAALAQDMEAAAKAKGPNVLKAQQKENAYYKAGRQRIREHFDEITQKTDPNALFDNLMSGGKRGAEELRTVMKSLKTDERDVVASAVLTRIGKTPGSALEEFSAETFLTNWRNLQPEAKKALFAGTSNKHLPQSLDKIAEAAAVMRHTQRTLPNPSGTAAAGIGGLTLGGLLTYPLQTLATVGGSGAVEVLFTRPWFARWVEAGAALPESALQSHIVRFAVLAERDPELSQYAEELSAALPQSPPPAQQLTPEQIYRSIRLPTGAR